MTAGASPFRPWPLTHQGAFTSVLRTAIVGHAGGGCSAPAADIGTAMSVLAAARLDLDRMEARLLETTQEGAARAAISRITGLTRAVLDEYVQRLRPHHNGPETAAGS
jgi:hypothetical protein